MADLKSQAILDVESSPPVALNASHFGGKLRPRSETIAVGDADGDNSTYRFFRVRSSDSVKSLVVSNTSPMAGASVYVWGLYDINGGPVVALSLWGPLDLADLFQGEEIAYEVLEINFQVWELLGLSVDPQKSYDLTMTATTAVTTGGSVMTSLLYTAGD